MQLRQWITAILMLLVSSLAHAQGTSPMSFQLTSSSLTADKPIPPQYTCDGKDTSPQLSWSGAPDNTKSFALIMSDPDAPNDVFYHWVVFNLPKATNTLEEGVTSYPSGTVIGKNSFGKSQYNGPCPPKDTKHRYIFTLHALDSSLDLPASSNAQTVLAALQSHIIATANFSATFGH